MYCFYNIKDQEGEVFELTYENNMHKQKQEQPEDIENIVDNINPYDHEVHITTITGPPALHMINCLKRGQSFSFKDISIEGVPILKVYAEVDPGFWWD